MHTYYQKHQTISAFQFDGTFGQLQAELPARIYADLCAQFAQYRDQIYVDPDQIKVIEIHGKRYFQNLTIQTSKYWPTTNQKIKGNTDRWFFAALYYHDNRPFKYRNVAKVLHLGDYIYLSHHQLHIVGQANFESHWSQNPIRK